MNEENKVFTTYNAIRSRLVMGAARSTEHLPDLPEELSAILPPVQTDEERLLLALSALDAYRYAGGFSFTQVLTSARPAAPDVKPLLSRHAGRIVVESLKKDALPGLFQVILEVFHRSGQRLPEEFLPLVLSWAASHIENAAGLYSVIGQRGLWLADINPAWREVSFLFKCEQLEPEKTNEIWETSALVQRIVLLRSLRNKGLVDKRFLATSQHLLESTWPTDSVAERVNFLTHLKVGLSLADEQILAKGLADRSKEVRKTTVNLLACLPGSKWEKRIAELAMRYVHCRAGKYMRKSALEIDLPEVFLDEMGAIGLAQNPPGDVSLTTEAWWLLQLITYTYPDRWCSAFERTPDQLLAMATQSDWKGLLFTAWLKAAHNYRSEPWAESLLRLHPGESGLLTVLSTSTADDFIKTRLQASFVDGAALLKNYDRPWSDSLTELFGNRFAAFLASDDSINYPPRLRDGFVGMAAWMSANQTSQLTEIIARAADESQPWRLVISKILAILEIRKKFEEETNG